MAYWHDIPFEFLRLAVAYNTLLAYWFLSPPAVDKKFGLSVLLLAAVNALLLWWNTIDPLVVDMVPLLGIPLYWRIPHSWREIVWVRMGLLGLACAFVGPRLLVYPPERLGWGVPWQTNIWPVLGVTIVGVCVLAFFARRRGPVKWWTLNMGLSFLTYPALGFLQQFLMLSYINVRLEDLHVHPVATAAITSLVFMSIHTQKRFWLGTGAMGFCFSLLFQYQPNFPLFGIIHGWVATLFYYWWLQEDPIGGILKAIPKAIEKVRRKNVR
ncbi:MAG: hypothetical protein AAB515_00710 [Patescibacteria group bacterium]